MGLLRGRTDCYSRRFGHWAVALQRRNDFLERLVVEIILGPSRHLVSLYLLAELRECGRRLVIAARNELLRAGCKTNLHLCRRPLQADKRLSQGNKPQASCRSDGWKSRKKRRDVFLHGLSTRGMLRLEEDHNRAYCPEALHVQQDNLQRRPGSLQSDLTNVHSLVQSEGRVWP